MNIDVRRRRRGGQGVAPLPARRVAGRAADGVRVGRDRVRGCAAGEAGRSSAAPWAAREGSRQSCARALLSHY